MSNNIAVSITADIADLQAKRAILSQELKSAQKDLNDFAKTAKTGGMTDELRTSMLAAGDAVAKAQAQIRGVDRELKALTNDTHGHTAALGLNRAQTITAQSAVMRFTDAVLAGQSPLRAFALEAHKGAEVLSMDSGGMAGGMAKLTALLTPLNIGVAAGAAAFVAATVAEKQYQDGQDKLTASTMGVAAASGMTAAQLDEAGAAAASWSGQSIAASTEAATAFAGAGVRSQAAITSLSGDVQIYAALTGEKAADAQKELAAAMQDPIKGAQSLNEKLGILSASQMEQIRVAVEAGDKDKAVAIILGELQRAMGEAKSAGVGLNSTFGDMAAGLSNLWNWLGRSTDALDKFIDKYRIYNLVTHDVEKGEAAAKTAESVRSNRAQLTGQSNAGAALTGATPEARDAARRQELVDDIKRLDTALVADTALSGAHSAAVQRDRQALEDYHRALSTFIPTAEKAHQIAQLDAQISEARRKHDKAGVESLTQQKAMLNVAGEVMSPDEAAQRASDAADKSGAATGKAKGSKGPGAVAQWQEQLHQQEIASGEYFKDQTAGELAFWQSKLALTQSGSKDWIEVQAKIYEANKSLARDDYQQHLAGLNERIEADRDNWSKEQADWTEKLAYIKGKFGEQSAEYQNAYRDMERAQHQHDEKELSETKRSVEAQIEARRRAIEGQQKSRQADAQGATSVIRADTGGSLSPIAEASAAVRIGQINAQLNEQKMTDLEQFHAFETQLLDKAISDAAAKYGSDALRYRDLTDLKKKADQDYANSRAEIEAQTQAKSLQDMLAVRQAYAQSINGMVAAGTSGFLRMATGTQTWSNTVRNVYSSALGTIEQRLTGFVTRWIAQHLLMTAAERAQLALQTGTHVAAEAAKTGATVVGNEARVVATAAGASQSAAITSLHNMKEITSHAATAAAAAYHAMAGIPVVGPVLGAVAAATTFVAVEAFGALASFDKGTNSLPSDMIAQVHKGERIVPAADNAQLLAAVGRGTGDGGKRGDTHLHYSPQLQGDTKPFRRQLHDHASDLVAMINRATRDGVLKVG